MRISYHQNTIPSIKSMFAYNCFHRMYLLTHEDMEKCTPTHLSYYEMKYGNEVTLEKDAHLKFKITKENGYFCLKVRNLIWRGLQKMRLYNLYGHRVSSLGIMARNRIITKEFYDDNYYNVVNNKTMNE